MIQRNKSKAEKNTRLACGPNIPVFPENFMKIDFKILKMCRHAVFIECSLLSPGLRQLMRKIRSCRMEPKFKESRPGNISPGTVRRVVTFSLEETRDFILS